MGVRTTKRHRIRRYVLALICSAYFCAFALRSGIVPFMQELADSYGAGYASAGGLMSAFFAGYALFQIPSGWLADRYDERLLLTPGLAAMAAASLAFAFSGSYAIAFASRFAVGAATALFHCPAIKVIATTFPREQRGVAMGYRQIAVGLGTMFALSGLPLLATAASFSTLLAALPLLCVPLLVGLLVAPRAGGPSRPDARGLPPLAPASALLSQPSFVLLLAVSFLAFAGINGVTSWLPTLLKGWLGYAPGRAATAMFVLTLALVACSVLAGKASDRTGTRMAVTAAGAALIAASLVVLAVGRNSAVVVMLAVALTGGAAAAVAVPSLLFSAEFPGRELAASATALSTLAAQSGSAISTYLYGYIIDATGSYAVLAFSMAGTLALAALASLPLAISPARRAHGAGDLTGHACVPDCAAPPGASGTRQRRRHERA